MAILRSRRLEQIFDAPLDEVTAEHIRRLVTTKAAEAADLDFKAKTPGPTDAEKVKLLLKPTAALANSGGGVVVYGVQDDGLAQAIDAAGVSLSDATELQMRQAIATSISPMPRFELRRVPDSPEGDHGFYLLIVPPSGSAPHGLKSGSAYRYPRRNGASTIDLTEPEIAAAYRDRFRARDERTQRLTDVMAEGEQALSRQQAWLIVALVPDVAGEVQITQQLYDAFEAAWRPKSVWAFGPRQGSEHFNHCRVGLGKLHADDGHQRLARKDVLAERGLAELHVDGSGLHALAPRYVSRDGQIFSVVVREQLLASIAIGLQRLGQHAQSQAGASGLATVRCTLLPAGRHLSKDDAGDFGTPMVLRGRDPVWADDDLDQKDAINGRQEMTVWGVDLDEIARADRPLLRLSSKLANQLANAFGEPELGLTDAEGNLTRAVSTDWAAAFQTWLAAR
ncbi:helix-turn-helix domain-containing protein [Kribbella sp. NPDC049174]|uniref:AlbA family DNA-binding domain-containing protein n=1 Tax=Kribbella sp. NPDC049174 TaxID=3364112 RepID=UPI0037119669